VTLTVSLWVCPPVTSSISTRSASEEMADPLAVKVQRSRSSITASVDDILSYLPPALVIPSWPIVVGGVVRKLAVLRWDYAEITTSPSS